MKYLVALLAGMLVGAALFLVALYHNPFTGEPELSPLNVDGGQLIDLSYSPVAGEVIAVTNSGKAPTAPKPEKITELWEPSIRKTRILVTTITSHSGEEGIGIKFASDSERTRLLNAEAMVDSAWHIWLPDSGTLFIDQTENLWPYLRNIVVPAKLSSSDSWRGVWYGTTTAGPNALGTARMTGGSGQFAGIHSEAIESLRASAWSAAQGPVAMNGNLLISLTNYTAD